MHIFYHGKRSMAVSLLVLISTMCWGRISEDQMRKPVLTLQLKKIVP
jgi:hypothetical protein